jgi:SAM-dependent methyltransferase
MCEDLNRGDIQLHDNSSRGADRLQDPAYFGDLNEDLLRAIRPQDRTILTLACGDGRFGHRIKHARGDIAVIGVEADEAAASRAREVLDAVHVLDIETEMPPVAAGSIDCIVLDKALQTVGDPVQLLRKLTPLLSPGGRVIAAVDNGQNFDTLASLIAGDAQPNKGPLDCENLRLLAAANIQKLFLDAGLMPRFTGAATDPVPQGLAEAFMPIVEHLKLNPDFFMRKLATRQYICAGHAMPRAKAGSRGITFIAAVNNPRQARDNLLASPIFRGARHELICVTGAQNAADALRTGLSKAKDIKDLIVLLHQDIYLPEGWDDKLIAGIEAAEQTLGPVGIAGVFGVLQTSQSTFERAGKVVDRHTTLETPHSLPTKAVSLDEIVLAFPVRNGAIAGLEADLGFHMYGSEVCLKIRDAGEIAVIVDAPCLHNSETGSTLGEDFARSAQLFASRRKASFPYATTCVRFDSDGAAKIW